MPTHKTHLAIAKKVNEKINLDLDQIMLGSVLPDIVEGENHQIAHFQHGEKDLEGLANPDEFVKKYKNKLSNPVMIGFLIHILSDRFYNEYFFKQFYIYDKDENGIGMILKGKRKLLNDEERKNLKHREMYLYDRWLLNHNYIPKFNSFECINKVEDIDEASFNKEKLREYIKATNNDIDKVNFFSKLFIYNYKITNQKEMDKLFNECINYITKYLNNINII